MMSLVTLLLGALALLLPFANSAIAVDSDGVGTFVASFWIGVVAIVLGVFAWRRAVREGSRSAKWMAILGMVFGAFRALPFVLLWVLFLFE